MKQHITPDQLRELSNSDQIEIATLFGEYGNCCNTGGETMNIGKLSDRITIGRMIDVLIKNNESDLPNILEDYARFIREDYDEKFGICDALWEAIKSLL